MTDCQEDGFPPKARVRPHVTDEESERATERPHPAPDGDPDQATDAELLDQAFALTGAGKLPAVRAEEGRILDIYRAELEDALDHSPTPADLAILDSVRRCRSFVLLLTRKAYGRGTTTRQGEVRGTVTELRQWIRLEADLLGRLAFRSELPETLAGYLESRGVRPQEPAEGTNAGSGQAAPRDPAEHGGEATQTAPGPAPGAAGRGYAGE